MLDLVYKKVGTVQKKLRKPLTEQSPRSHLTLKFGVYEIIFQDKTGVRASKDLKRTISFMNISGYSSGL